MCRPYPPRWITKKNDSFRLETLYFSPSSSTHSVPAAAFSISAWPWRAAEERISFFRKRTQKSTGSRHPVCGSISTNWKLPVLSESFPESPHASQTDMSFVRAGSCRRHPFVRIPPWLYVVNLSRMETRAGRKRSHRMRPSCYRLSPFSRQSVLTTAKMMTAPRLAVVLS